MHFPAAIEFSCPLRDFFKFCDDDEVDADLALEDDTAVVHPNYAALSLPSGRVLEIHGLGVLDASIKTPSRATKPSFILRNPDGSVEESGALDVGEWEPDVV